MGAFVDQGVAPWPNYVAAPPGFAPTSSSCSQISRLQASRPSLTSLSMTLSEISVDCQGHSSLDTPSELNLPQRIPSPLFVALLVPQAEG